MFQCTCPLDNVFIRLNFSSSQTHIISSRQKLPSSFLVGFWNMRDILTPVAMLGESNSELCSLTHCALLLVGISRPVLASTQQYMCYDSFASSTPCLSSKWPVLLQQTMLAQLNETQNFPSHVGTWSRSFSLRQWLWVRPPHKRHAITRCYKKAKKQPPSRLPVPEEVYINPELLLTAKLKSWLSSELLPCDTKEWDPPAPRSASRPCLYDSYLFEKCAFST